MEERSNFVFNLIQEQHQLSASIDEEFQAVTKRLIQSDHDKIQVETAAQQLQTQLDSQKRRLAELTEQVELTKTKLKETRDVWQQQQDSVIQIAVQQREIPYMKSKITELEAMVEDHKQIVALQIEECTTQINLEIEQKKLAHKESLDQKSKQFERDLKALRLILAQEDDCSFLDNLRQQHQDELDRLRIELQQHLEMEKTRMHSKCQTNVEELKKKIDILKKRIQHAEDNRV